MSKNKNKEEPTCQRLGAASCSTEVIYNHLNEQFEISLEWLSYHDKKKAERIRKNVEDRKLTYAEAMNKVILSLSREIDSVKRSCHSSLQLFPLAR